MENNSLSSSNGSSSLTIKITAGKVLKSSLYSFLSVLISRIGGLIFTIIIARSLFPELFGIYSLALTIILTLATFTDLGLNATLIRYLAESLKIKTKKAESKAKAKARSRLCFLFGFKILLTACFSLVLFFAAKPIALYIFKKPLLISPIQLGALYLFTISLQGFFSSIFYSLQKVSYIAIGETIFQVLRIALVALLFSFYKSVSTAFIALIIASFAAFVFFYSILAKRYSFLLKGKKQRLEKEEKRKLLGFFGWLTISSISLIFFAHVDIFMLGIFLPAQFAGFYNAIFTIVGAIASFVAFGSVLLPVFTQLEENRIERGFRKVFRYLTMLAIPAAIGLAFVIVPAIQLIYGQAYLPLSYKLAITITSVLLSLLVVEAALTAAYSSLFQAKELPKIPSLLIVIVSIANIILNYAFIKAGLSIAEQYGLVGVALATLLVRYGNMAGLAVLARKKLKIKIRPALVIKPLIASFVMLAFLFAFDWLVPLNILNGILMIIAAIFVYFIVLWITKGLEKKDFSLIKEIRI
ncbi:MAG: oligosaccharide flippase family protein [Candidatus Pacearchaeota archaeon]